MKIYIDWDEQQWYTDEDQFFDGLVANGDLKTYSDFLVDEYDGRFDELLDLTEREKTNLHERYRMDLTSEFEDKVKFCKLNCTVLYIEKDNVIIKEIL